MDVLEIARLNPWWSDSDAIRRDRLVVSFEESRVKYLPIEENVPPGIYTLRGMRQIGKTTVMKVLIKRLIAKGVSPRAVLWLTGDGMRDRFELLETLKTALSLMESVGKFIFIDEVSFIDGWQYAIKYAVDTGLIDPERDFVLLSGSSAFDIYRGRERLPGRRGSGRDIVFLPITLGEFVSIAYDIDIPRLALTDILDLTEKDINSLIVEFGRLRPEFEKYMLIGGIPAVLDATLKGLDVERYIQIFSDVAVGDIERFSRNRRILITILMHLLRSLGNRFSFSSVAREVGVHTATVEDYLYLLSYAFVLGIVPFVDMDTGRIMPRKQKKVYPADPFLIRVFENITGQHVGVHEGFLAEVVTYAHLVSVCDVRMGLIGERGPYFWYSKSGKEVDFVVSGVPIEVKYQRSISPSDYATIKRNWGRGIVLTRLAVGQDGGVVLMPLWLFSLLLSAS